MHPVLQLVGTFLPVIGLAITFLLAAKPGKLKVWAMWLGPALTLALSMLFGKAIAYNGNMLFVLLLCLLFVFAIIYYPVMAVMVIIRKLKEPDD